MRWKLGVFVVAVLVIGMAGSVGASPIVLADGASQSMDFFTLTQSGIAVSADSTVEATLAFDIAAADAGAGQFATFYLPSFGGMSGGTLTWIDTSPGVFKMSDGTTLEIAFQSGAAILVGDTVMVHSTLTNQGGGNSPVRAVPEPGTLLLLGSGLVGVAVLRGKKTRKN